jgi:general secretion pathway protein A
MYQAHFGLRRRPFRSTPDSEAYYPATGHERVLAALQRAIADDESLIVLSGAPGTGKTLLCHLLLDRLGNEVTAAFLTYCHISNRAGLLQAILYDLDQPYADLTESELRLHLTDFLLKNFADGRRTVLLIDEAQQLSAELLEELRLLSNLEASDGKAVQIVLVGQPHLLTVLRQPALAAFNQRVAVRLNLDALAVEEAADYLRHHLRAAGGRPESIASDEAMEVLARGVGGVPRLLNQAARQSLALAAEAGERQVDVEVVMEALHALGLDAVEAEDLPDETPLEPEASEHAADAEPVLAIDEPGTTEEPDASTKSSRRHRLFAPPRRLA